MKKYKFIGMLMVMAGNGNLSAVLLDELNYNIQPDPQAYVGSITVMLLGFYILRLGNSKSIV